MVVFGCYVVGRYTKFGPLYLSYGGVCALLWVPFYSPYASFIGRNGNGTWLAYIGLAFTLMICCRLAARFGYNAGYHEVDASGHVQIEEQCRTMA